MYAVIVFSGNPLTIFEESSILDVWLGFQYASGIECIKTKELKSYAIFTCILLFSEKGIHRCFIVELLQKFQKIRKNEPATKSFL